MTAKPIIGFFGATGGCTLNALVLTLKDDFKAVALARTPSKLSDLLVKDHKIPQSTIDSNLTIVKGSATDLAPVKEVLSHNPSIIITGLGAAPVFQWSLTRPMSIDQPTLCGDAMQILVAAVKEVQEEGKLSTKPAIVCVSTTGISPSRDVPWLFYHLYHVLLAVPHKDKRVMEETLAAASVDSSSGVAGYASVRASLLTNGALKGPGAVKTGWERHPKAPAEPAGPGPALGYVVSRADVGNFIFENIVRGKTEEWTGKCFTVTY